jgi:hypothetical protein
MHRTGSSLLTYLLDQHPHIACWDGEIFWQREIGAWSGSSLAPQQFIMERILRVEAGAIGFKLLADQIEAMPELWDVVQELGIKLVHCIRPNHLDNFLSFELATLNENFVHGPYAKQRVRLDPSEAVRWFERCETANRVIQIEAARRNIPLIEIEYDDIAAGRLGDVLRFIGAQAMPLACHLRKQRTTTQREAIANYNELAASLDGTKWAGLLT